MSNPTQQTGRDAQMVNCNTEQGSCKACQRKGWPVMLVRRVFSAETKNIVGHDNIHFISTSDASKEDPPSRLLKVFRHMSSNKRNVRMLREGHLYALVVNSAGQVIYTYHYAVTPEGYLRLASVVNSSNGEVKKFPPLCQANGHGVNAACIHIDDEYIGHGNKLLLAFANDEWCSSVLNNYRRNTDSRRFKVLDIDTLVTNPAAAAKVPNDDNYASSYHGIYPSRNNIGGRAPVQNDVYDLESAPVVPLEMFYPANMVPTAHPSRGDWHGKSLGMLCREFRNNYLNANTTVADRRSAAHTPYRTVNVLGTTVYEITHADGRVEHADRPPTLPAGSTATRDYQNVQAKMNARKVPLVIVDDPVGDLWELNFMRQALEFDRYVWSADPQRLAKRLSQQAINTILDDHFTGCNGQGRMCQVTKPKAGHFYNYYNQAGVDDFEHYYDSRLSYYDQTLTDMIEENYVRCWNSPMLAAVLALDYARDATNAAAEDRESATALTMMMARCLEGGVLYVKYKNEERHNGVNFDAKENAVFKLWKDWLGNPRSYLYQAIFRNNTVLLSKLEVLFNGNAVDAIAAQTLARDYLALFSGVAELSTWWRRRPLLDCVNALILGVVSARQLLETEARTARKADCMMQIAAGLYEGLQFTRLTMMMRRTQDLEAALNADSLKGPLLNAMAKLSRSDQQTWAVQITPHVDLDQKASELVAWAASPFALNFEHIAGSGVSGIRGIYSKSLVAGVSQAAVNGFTIYYLCVSLQQSFKKLNETVKNQTSTYMSIMSGFISITSLAMQALSVTMGTVGVVAVKCGASLSTVLGRFVTVSSLLSRAAAWQKLAGRVAVFASILDMFNAAFRFWASNRGRENRTVMKYRLGALVMYACVVVLSVVALIASSLLVVIVASLVALACGVMGFLFDTQADANSHSAIDRWIHRTPWGQDKPSHGLTTPRMPEGVPYRWGGENVDLMMAALLAAAKGVEPYIAITAVSGAQRARVTFRVSMPGYQLNQSGYSALGYVQHTRSRQNGGAVNCAVFKRASGRIEQRDMVIGPRDWLAGPNLADNIASQTSTANDIVISRTFNKVPDMDGAKKLVVESELDMPLTSVAFAVVHAKYWPDYGNNNRECAEVVYAEGSRRHYSLTFTRWMGELLF